MPGGSSYQIVAKHGLYLDNADVFNVTGNATKSTRLWGGDANNDHAVSMADLTCIGGSFGLTLGTCGGTGSPDINVDAKVKRPGPRHCGRQPGPDLTATLVICNGLTK